MSNAVRNIKEDNSVRINVPYGTHLDISFETITPGQAKIWLEKNSDNQRSASTSIIRQYAREMKNGEWYHDTAECIKFSDDGNLIDGQHRLKGIVLADIPVMMMIIRNINHNHIKSMDLGKKRSIKDIIQVQNIVMPIGYTETHIGSLIRDLYDLKNYVGVAHSVSKTYRIDSYKKMTPTPLELFNFLEKNIHFIESLRHLSDKKVSMFFKRGLSVHNIIGWYAVSLIDKEIADIIFYTLRDGVAHSKAGHDCPAVKLLQYINNKKELKQIIRAPEYAALWLWTFEHITDKKKPKHLKIGFSNMPAQGHTGSKKLVEQLERVKI